MKVIDTVKKEELDLTTEELIRAEVVERVPEVREVALVQETSRELLDQAREILRRRHGG